MYLHDSDSMRTSTNRNSPISIEAFGIFIQWRRAIISNDTHRKSEIQ